MLLEAAASTRPGSTPVALVLGLAGQALWTTAYGPASPASVVRVNPGLVIGVRGGPSFGAWALEFGLDARLWLRSQRLQQSDHTVLRMPQFVAALTIGVAYGLW